MHAVTDLVHNTLSAPRAWRRVSRAWLAALCALVFCFCLCLPALPLFAAAQQPAALKKEAQQAKAAPPKKAPQRKSPQVSKIKPGHYDVKSTITLDLTRKRVLHEQNADRLIPPASLTKVLTMFVVMDQVKAGKVSLNETVTVSAKAAATGGSHMSLMTGEKLPLRELMKGMAIASGNDAAVAAAQHVAGNEAAFVKLMNAKAKQLGMRSSVFKNVHGLPAKGQYTTARDMLAMTTRYLSAHPETLALFHTQRYLAHRGHTPNTNPLLGMEGVDGLKTGYVGESGYNLITTARRGNTRLVNVLLGAPSKSVRLHEATKMVEKGFATAELQAAKDQEAAKAKGAKSSQGKVQKKKSVTSAKVAATTSSKARQPQTSTAKKSTAAQYAKSKVSPEAGG